MTISNLSIRAHLWYAGHGPQWLAFILARLHPNISSLKSVGDCWWLETITGSFYLSDPRQITRHTGIGISMQGRVLQKYTLPGFVEVESGDTVVDVGAFIGEFSKRAGEIGDRIIAVEPDDRNAAALRRNLSHLSESYVVEKAAWKETGQHEFQVAGDPSEGSILEVDSNDVTDVVTLETIRVDDLVAEIGVESIDYLKIEAEGAEPEVLESVGKLKIGKIAVECAPERDGETPKVEVTGWLRDRGYAVRTRDNIVFGRL